MDGPQTNKAFRVKKSGAKVKRKEAKVERHNPKAFSFSGGHVSVQRRVQRSAEITEKRLKVSFAKDKSSWLSNAPPYVVVVHGPPGCGKTTLIKSLVKHYTRRTISVVGGPITLVSSKSRRLTLVECDSSMASMIDMAKVADLAIVMIDSRKGIELDSFEFVNLMQNHGMPKVIGVLTHLDHFAEKGDRFVDTKSLRKLKKRLKNRFWSELYNGAKLFYLCGIRSRRYLQRETLNLARFIATTKYEPIVWRSHHPYMIALGMEIEAPTQQELEENRRTCSFTGYLKGAPAREGYIYHVPGCGDFSLKKILTPEDPCPLPTNRQIDLRKQGDAARHVYAPMCDIGSLSVEGTSIYVTLHDKKSRKRNLSDDDDDDMSESESDEHSARDASDGWDTDDEEDGKEVKESDSEQDEDDDGSVVEGGLPQGWNCEFEEAVWTDRRDTEHDDSANELLTDEDGDDEDGDDEGDRRAKGNGSERNSVIEQLKTASQNLQDLDPIKVDQENWYAMVYQNVYCHRPDWQKFMSNHSESNDYTVDLFSGKAVDTLECWESTKVSDEYRFATLKTLSSIYEEERATKQLEGTQDDRTDTEEDKIEGDNETCSGSDSASDSVSDSESTGSESTGSESTGSVVGYATPLEGFCVSLMVLKSLRQVAFATGGWDAGVSEEERVLLREESEKGALGPGWALAAGTFVRMTLSDVDNAWVEELRANPRAILLGGIKSSENALTFIHARGRRHRWSPGILKSTEPLLFSAGWRRFQSLPYFAMEERESVRNRYLKYTPEHLHCQVYFHGYAVPPGTGLVAIKYAQRTLKSWRISLTGVAVENVAVPRVMKKLKFIGNVHEVLKNTAFVNGMFTSDLEVSRCIGVPIQTQSGIRGMIKKPKGQDGTFRATFEAPVNKNDVVICKAWYRVPMEPYCNPMLDLPTWDKLRTFVEVRRAEQLAPTPQKPDSVYKPLEIRNDPEVKPLKVPRQLQDTLPFAELKKTLVEEQDKTKPVKYTPYEHMVNKLLQQVVDQKRQVLQQQRDNLDQKKSRYAKAEAKRAAASAAKIKATKKSKFASQGKNLKSQRKRMRMD
ncbi:putative preribosomal protein RNA [Gregarina niphandrodes]|uniref:Preribosomal protein RNA n=1 Tax=Gregarina niphandrodes TaxID=110365 RepID=A0A023B5C2_GRENI|nr:putative preribosomal protein RNA [Gregarina niphandrodes]EZG59485.1 putative preribosomal protein RNA [Gregarina niphandrodes]|eukprot:XP_011130888.1 putative preribosomal protein RNA [Gregarina niphandrodes]